jgi:CBS domain containing-hemolysin-like protein
MGSVVGGNLLLILAAALLVVLNGFFVAAEFGMVKLRTTRVRAIAKTYGWRGRILARVHRHLDRYLSACQLGITLASLGLGWIGEPVVARLLEPLFAALGIGSPQLIGAIAFFVAFVSISYVHIVVGELAPKSLAIRNPEAVAIWTGLPLYLFYWLMYPAIWMLNHSSNWVLRLAGSSAAHSHETQYSVDELKLILRTSRPSEKVTGDEWRVLAHALDFRDLEVGDLLRPFSEAVALHQHKPIEENLDRMAQHRYSRYPVLDEAGIVIGVIHLKDVFIAMRKDGLPRDLKTLLRPVLTVSPNMPAPGLFRRFQQGAPHFAVVAYDDGRPLGFVTLDNLLGALVGEIRDEFRQSHNEWVKLDDGSLIGKGSLQIFTLERALGLDIESEADTVAGLVLAKLGDMPHEGEKIDFDDFSVVVKKMRGPRVLLVRVYPHQPEDHTG